MASAKRILLVDDDPDILEALMLTFESEGYETTGTGKGTEVLQTAYSTQPQVIVLDVLLSGMDGRKICSSIKHDNRTKHIPIVMISAYPNAEQSVRNAGADGFVAKPFDLDELISVVDSVRLQ